MQSITDKKWVEKLLHHLETNELAHFFTHFSKEITWTVEGGSPISGSFHGLNQAEERIFDRLFDMLKNDPKIKVETIVVDGSTAAVLLYFKGDALNGKHFHNRQCWVMRFDDKTHKILEIRSFVDEASLIELFRDNATLRKSA
jgi:ketosteroid isomerase-like protein